MILNTDTVRNVGASLGSYLQSLGLLQVASEIDPDARGWWDRQIFTIEHDREATQRYLLDHWRGRYSNW